MKDTDLENIFEYLENECKAAGTNLTEVCRVAGIRRSVVEKWKGNNPKTIDILAELVKSINQIKRKPVIIKSVPSYKKILIRN